MIENTVEHKSLSEWTPKFWEDENGDFHVLLPVRRGEGPDLNNATLERVKEFPSGMVTEEDGSATYYAPDNYTLFRLSFRPNS